MIKVIQKEIMKFVVLVLRIVIVSLRKFGISIDQCKDLSPSGSRPGIMYGLPKVNKIVTDGLPFLDLFYLQLVHQHTSLQSF